MAGEISDPYSAVGGSLLDFGINSIMTSSANAKSKRAAEKSAWLNFAMQNYFMDKQNEYNKPINQMKRLEEAGLNPNLVYGNGNAIMASASPSGGGVDTAGVRSMDKLNILGAMQALRNQKLEEKEIDSRINSNNANIDLAKARLDMQSGNLALQYGLAKERLGLLRDALGLKREQMNEPTTTIGRHIRDFEKIMNHFVDMNGGEPLLGTPFGLSFE